MKAKIYRNIICLIVLYVFEIINYNMGEINEIRTSKLGRGYDDEKIFKRIRYGV